VGIPLTETEGCAMLYPIRQRLWLAKATRVRLPPASLRHPSRPHDILEFHAGVVGYGTRRRPSIPLRSSAARWGSKQWPNAVHFAD